MTEPKEAVAMLMLARQNVICPDCGERVEPEPSQWKVQPRYHEGCCHHDHVETDVDLQDGYSYMRTVTHWCTDCAQEVYPDGEGGWETP